MLFLSRNLSLFLSRNLSIVRELLDGAAGHFALIRESEGDGGVLEGQLRHSLYDRKLPPLELHHSVGARTEMIIALSKKKARKSPVSLLPASHAMVEMTVTHDKLESGDRVGFVFQAMRAITRRGRGQLMAELAQGLSMSLAELAKAERGREHCPGHPAPRAQLQPALATLAVLREGTSLLDVGGGHLELGNPFLRQGRQELLARHRSRHLSTYRPTTLALCCAQTRSVGCCSASERSCVANHAPHTAGAQLADEAREAAENVRNIDSKGFTAQPQLLQALVTADDGNPLISGHDGAVFGKELGRR